MKHVVDTNTVSGLMRGDLGVAKALARLARSDVLIPQPAVAEIEYGLSRLPSSKRKMRLQKRWNVIRGEIHRAPWSDDTSEAFGRIKAELERTGVRLEDFDAAIAAHAVALEATLVTDDVAHFGRIKDLRVVSWRHREE